MQAEHTITISFSKLKTAILLILVVLALGLTGLLWWSHVAAEKRQRIALAEATVRKYSLAKSTIDRANKVGTDYFNKMKSAIDVAGRVSQRRHDQGYSLSWSEIRGLAHTERIQVEAATRMQQSIEHNDESFLKAYSDVYGDSVVAALRRDLASRNEARDNFLNYWWRAAQDVEDMARAVVNGMNPGISNSEIESDYNQSSVYGTKSRGEQQAVTAEANVLYKRLSSDLDGAREKLMQVGGGIR